MEAIKSSGIDSIQHSNLVELLKTFSKEEIKEFDKFLRSPFHNNRNDVIRYYSTLKEYYPLFNQKNFTREYIFSKLYPGEEYNDPAIRVLGSKLMAEAEYFISLRHIKRDEFLFRVSFMDDMLDRKLGKLFQKTFNETEHKLDSSPRRNGEYYKKKSQLEALRMRFQSDVSHHKIKFQPDQAKSALYFINYFLIEILEGYLVFKDSGTLYKNEEKIDIIDKLISLLGTDDSKLNPLVSIYLMCHKLRDNPAEHDLFFKIKELLSKENEKFEKRQLRILYILLTNYCEDRMAVGFTEIFKGVKFGLFKEMLNLGLQFNERGEFLDYSFIRYVETGLLNRDFDWTEKFIRKYAQMLNESDRDNYVNYAWADVELMRCDYDKCMVHLAKTNFPDIIEKLQIKKLFLRCYYETGSFNEALSMIDSVRHTINSIKDAGTKNLSNNLKERYGNFIKYLEKVIKLRLGESKTEPGLLMKKIKKTENIWDANWLLRKVEEIGK